MLGRVDSASRREGGRVLIVVSAPAGITELLYSLYSERLCPAARVGRIREIQKTFQYVYRDYLACDVAVASGTVRAMVENSLHDVNCLLQAIEKKSRKRGVRAEVISLGEQLNARIFNKILFERGVDSSHLPARYFLSLKNGAGNELDCDLIKSKENFKRRLPPSRAVVVDGFSGVTKKGDLRLLGRGGSDLTATVLARLSGSRSATLVKDVAGVFNADPKKYKHARKIHLVDAQSLRSFSLLGAKNLYEKEFPNKNSYIPRGGILSV